MLEVFLCCSPGDREVAATIASRLEQGAEVTVAVDDGETESVAAKWESGLSSAAILLLLSPEAVPGPPLNRADWGTLLDHVSKHADPPIGSLLVRSCNYPKILERQRFFRWDEGNPRETLRAIGKWALRLHLLPEQRSFAAARLPWFEGREPEFELLWETLVDQAGTAILVNPAPASGKTCLAQEFCRQAGEHFRDILWVDCGDRSLGAIAADLAEQIGVECEGEAREAFADLLRIAGKHRLLVVLDDVQANLAIPADSKGRASVLVTTRSTQWQAPHDARVIRIDKCPKPAVSIPENPVDLRLWRAMSVCRPNGFPFHLAKRIAEIDPVEARDACARLIQSRLVDPFDLGGERLRLNTFSIPAAGDLLDDERQRHAAQIHAAISGSAKGLDLDKRYVAEILPAVRWAAAVDWPLAGALTRRAFALLRQRGRIAEGAELLVTLRDAAERRGDWEVSNECSWELSWIRGLPYHAPDRTPVDDKQLSFDFAG